MVSFNGVQSLHCNVGVFEDTAQNQWPHYQHSRDCLLVQVCPQASLLCCSRGLPSYPHTFPDPVWTELAENLVCLAPLGRLGWSWWNYPVHSHTHTTHAEHILTQFTNLAQSEVINEHLSVCDASTIYVRCVSNSLSWDACREGDQRNIIFASVDVNLRHFVLRPGYPVYMEKHNIWDFLRNKMRFR